MGATKACARYFSDLFSSERIDAFFFTPVQTAFYPRREIAERAFRRLCAEIDGRHFDTFDLRLIRRNDFHTDFFTERAPRFTADNISFSFCTLSEKECPFLSEHLKRSGAKHISLADVSLGNELPELGRTLTENGVSDLSLSLYAAHSGIREFADGLGRSRLEKLGLALADIRPHEAEAVGENLPSALKLLTLSNMLLNDCALNVAASVSKMNDLFRLNLMSGGLTDDGLQRIANVLPPSLNGMAVYKQPAVSDRSARSVLDFVLRRDVFATSVTLRETGVSEKMQKEINAATENSKRTLEALEDARNKRDSESGKKTRAALERASRPDEIKRLLIDAAEIGSLSEALEKLKAAGGTLTAQEAEQKDGLGRSILGSAVEQRKAFLLFDARLIPNVKEMQMLRDALNEYGKRQICGRYGYPSYQKTKNEMMSAAVRKAVAQKSITG